MDEIMLLDIQTMRNFKDRLVKQMSTELQVDVNDARRIIDKLEEADFWTFEAPEYEDTPVSTLTQNHELLRTNLSMTSRKLGNIIINTRLDWRNVAEVIVGIIETIGGANLEHPFVLVTGILSTLLSLSSITSRKITQNGTAIIMALQKHSKHLSYTITEDQCLKEANEILAQYGYATMTNRTFQDALSELFLIYSIDRKNDNLILKERVILHYD